MIVTDAITGRVVGRVWDMASPANGFDAIADSRRCPYRFSMGEDQPAPGARGTYSFMWDCARELMAEDLATIPA